MTTLPLFRGLLLAAAFPAFCAAADGVPVKDQVALMSEAKARHETGIARKTREIDARPALAGEIIITTIKGEGVETRSKPAENGDWVVRNRCPETGNEEILVKAAKFPQRYGEPLSQPDEKGYRTFRPLGGDMTYFIVSDKIGAFNFTAPWGETMVAKPGDAIVQVPSDEKDTYRIAASSFKCTYEVTTPAK